jgi:hypothetical protein
MNRFKIGLAFLALAPAVVSGSHFHGDSQSTERVEAAAAAVLGLVEEGAIPAPAQLQVLRMPTDPTRGELPPPGFGDQALATAVLARLGGNTRDDGPSLATCEEALRPSIGVRCQFLKGIPVGIRVESLDSGRGVLGVSVLEPTDDPGMPLDLSDFRVSVSRLPSGAWRFGGVLSQASVQVNWRALAAVKPDTVVQRHR